MEFQTLKDSSLWNIIKSLSIKDTLAFCRNSEITRDICLSSAEVIKRKVSQMFGESAVSQRPDLVSADDWILYLENINTTYKYIYVFASDDHNMTIIPYDSFSFGPEYKNINEYIYENVATIINCQSLPIENFNMGEFGRMGVVMGDIKTLFYFFSKGAIMNWLTNYLITDYINLTDIRILFEHKDMSEGSVSPDIDNILQDVSEYIDIIKGDINPEGFSEITIYSEDRPEIDMAIII